MLRRLIWQKKHLVKTTHFMFIACNRNSHRFREDPSYTYRCENLGAMLEESGYKVSYCHLTQALNSSGDIPDIAIFHRPNYSFRFNVVFNWFKHHGVTLLADVDDLIFDKHLARHSPAVLNDLVSIKKIKKQFIANYKALKKFDAITVSTEPLAEHILQCFPKTKVEVLPNTIHHSWVNTHFPLHSPVITEFRARKLQKNISPVVTYFPGTRSHDLDFAVFASGVEEFLSKYPQAKFEITGPLDFKLSARPGQIIHQNKLPFELYHEKVCQAWVNLAPLQATPFTQCKSALKVLEAGYCGVPTICSPLPDAERFKDIGAFYANDAAACFQRLNMMMQPAYYQRITEGLSKKILDAACIEKTGQKFLNFIGLLPHNKS